ncbi:putative endoribonuclease L-PSP [Actinoplanes missouriensis 431]|uniref:Putative endoribonuclease L-PSP n=1 Tax=Actinoplanes missouriensis (strain ATCC 14538 / DSM 43046 / CBS 188.64 / JCM 3121 / NBRC 102363 / NCIMB 12654 / NRRL B-3342 / UNCC 431) TaxID=512565 RepID=I0H4A8_ACTM4|nr:RidA family protein [Actinoplanes missouriensis]BAL87845.1 putative endoribonuclease L-PSP [Actinoplanes missouriensis 431]
MAVTLINPNGLPEIPIYRQVSVATGSRLVHVAGQVSWDENGAPVGEGDLAAQVEQCYLNVGKALAGAGATFADVVKLTMHVVDWRPEQMPLVLDGISRAAAKLGITPAAPASLFGIVALDVPEHLVELEAVAVLD